MASFSGIQSVVVFSVNWASDFYCAQFAGTTERTYAQFAGRNKQKQFSRAVTHSSKEIFLEKISNGSHYSNFVNLCLKLGTGTPEDMISTNVSDNLDSNLGEFVLVHIVG